MIPAPIKKRIADDILAVAMSARLTGTTKEQNMRQLLQALIDAKFIRPISTHNLCSMYVEALMKLRLAQRLLGKKAVHIRKEMYLVRGPKYELSTNEWTNFGKLRYWGPAGP